MTRQINMKTLRRPFSPLVVTLLVGVVVVLFWSGPSAQAQTTTTTQEVVDSSITMVAKGTVNDPSGAITVNGSVAVTARRVIDTTGVSPPLVVLEFDFSNVQGSSGNGKTAKVYVTGGNHATEIRPLQASDTIIVTCPYFESTSDGLTAKTMLVTATLNFDISAGRLSSGTLSIGNNMVTAAEVGTFTVN